MTDVSSLKIAVDSKDVKGASRDLEQFSRSGARAEKSAGGLQGALSKINFRVLALGAAAAATGLAAFVKQQINLADSASKAAQAAGVSTEAYTSLAFAAKLSGVEAEQLGLAFTQLNQKIASNDQSLVSLGVQLRNFDGSAKSADQVLEDLADTFAKLPDGVEKTNRAIEVFGARAGPRLIPLLNQGKKGIQELRAEAERLGVVIATDTGRAAELFNDNLTRLSESARGVGVQIANFVLPTLAQLSTRLLQNARDAGVARGAFITLFEGIFGGTEVVDVARRKLGEYEKTIADLEQRLEFLSRVGRSPTRIRQLTEELERAKAGAESARQAIAQFQQDASRAPNNGAQSRLSQNTVANLQEQIKNLRTLRDNTEVGTAEFRRLNGEIARLETRLRSLTGSGGGVSRTPASTERVSEAERYTESLKRQLEAFDDLTAAQVLERDIAAGRLGVVSQSEQAILSSLARQIDARRELIKTEEEQAALSGLKRQLVIDEGIAVEKANEEYQTLIQSLLDATPTAQLERQREAMRALADEFEAGRINAQQFEEAAQTALGTLREEAKKTKSIGEELGLSFTSAFEDAVVNGKKFSDVLKGLEQDIIRIITRKLITEPLGNAISGIFSGGGNIFSNILGSIFGGGRAIGGPVSANRMYEVNERGPELLKVGGRQFLMMGAQGGTVSPAAAGSGGMQVVQNFHFSGSQPSRETMLQVGARANQGLAMAQRNM
jgi:hypothetical protein